MTPTQSCMTPSTREGGPGETRPCTTCARRYTNTPTAPTGETLAANEMLPICVTIDVIIIILYLFYVYIIKLRPVPKIG